MRLQRSRSGRGLPGFPGAAVAFLIVVLMGAGSAAADALWAQSAKTTVNVQAATVPAPTMTCTPGAGNSSVTLTLSAAPSASSRTLTSSAESEAYRGTDSAGTTYVITASSPLVSGFIRIGSFRTRFNVQLVDRYGTWDSAPFSLNNLQVSRSALTRPVQIACS